VVDELAHRKTFLFEVVWVLVLELLVSLDAVLACLFVAVSKHAESLDEVGMASVVVGINLIFELLVDVRDVEGFV